ncbi:peroxisomal membrane protein PEX14 isoform X2 [Malania oleifera]|uniref:peroxisomal membrane protein PEX14 isoform X2 n=1 Tax=Malania oleifera TaxID=397392 RepID=UPI0025ADD870|nr:peroxisomal membrane protein PEX14 isoform X2 [Malania oleifera]
MATQSMAPPVQADNNPQNPELVQPTNEDQRDANAEVAKVSSTPSVFVNTEPMREEQVQNAVKFLSHPKVRGSPVIYRRSFLEKKGLTKEEIDEAFRRVPDPPPTLSSVQAADGQLKPSSNVQPQSPAQTLQSAAAAPASVMSTVGTVTKSRFQWSHVFYTVGLLAVSGAGTAVLFKNAIIPRLKSWIRKVVLEDDTDLAKKTNSKPSLEEEAAAAAKAAAAAAVDVAKASQEMLISKNEERRYFQEFMNLLDVQTQEMKSMSTAIQKLEGQSNSSGRNLLVEQENRRVSVTSSKQPNVNGKAELNLRSVRSSSPPASMEPSVAPHPKSYMDLIDMVQRGEKPPNIRDINDLPPNPNQPLPNPRLVPRPKPWEVGQGQNRSSYVLQSQVGSDGFNIKAQDNGLAHESNGNGESSLPWSQHKNVRITEIESEEELKTLPYGASTMERPIQRAWVPPQPPPFVMPEAAAAIRQLKPSAPKEQFTNDQLDAHPSDETDELQRVARLSESGGVEIKGVNSESNLSDALAQE